MIGVHAVFGVLACCNLANSLRLRRDAVKEEIKEDLKPAETRVLGYGGYGGLDPYGPGSHLPYGVDPYAEGVHGAYGPGGLGHRPLGLPPVLGQDHGYLRSGVSDGALALGGHGGEIYSAGSDGRFRDGSFRQGHLSQDGGYQGLEGYRDNKHHIADDFANRGYYNGAHGIRKDIGNGEVFDKSHGYSQNGVNSLGHSELDEHKKGHQRKGFSKSYHRDESGNDESYYDSDHDEGNHALGKHFGDQYSTNAGGHLNSGHKLNEFEARENGNHGYDGTGKLLSLSQGVRDYHGSNGRFDGSSRYGTLGGGKFSNYDKYGLQNGFHSGYNNERNLDDYRGTQYGPRIY